MLEMATRVLMVIILTVCLAVPALNVFQRSDSDTSGYAGPVVSGGGFRGAGATIPAVNARQVRRAADDTI